VKVNSTNCSFYLIETDIVESFKASPGDLPHPMIRYEEILLPAHEQMLALSIVSVCEISFFSLFGEGPPRLEPGPVLHIGFFVGAPSLVLGHECVFCANDFSFEKGG
jgi:hypothetical protein